jgi:hypothetical protein
LRSRAKRRSAPLRPAATLPRDSAPLFFFSMLSLFSRSADIDYFASQLITLIDSFFVIFAIAFHFRHDITGCR